MLPDGFFIPNKVSELSATVLPDGRWLLYHRDQRTAVTLHAAAGILWELCDGRTPVTDLVTQLEDFYPNTSSKRLAIETEMMLNDFLARGLVVNNTAHAAS
jgi:hypothetical protein